MSESALQAIYSFLEKTDKPQVCRLSIWYLIALFKSVDCFIFDGPKVNSQVGELEMGPKFTISSFALNFEYLRVETLVTVPRHYTTVAI